MIVTLIPALFGGTSPTGGTPALQGCAPGPSSAPDAGPGFAALFLALLGGAPTRGAEGNATLSHEGTDPEGAATEGGEEAPEPSRLAGAVGRTTPVGWASLPLPAQGPEGVVTPAGGAVPVPDALRAEAAPAPGQAPGQAPAPSDTAPVDTGQDVAGMQAATTHVAAAPRDVRVADRNSEKLDPELREKVDRVVERMAAEHGIRVEVVEGYRTPERQNFLYTQGRSRPGPVVTWTKRSLHMEGRAADLKVEGPWTQREGYVHLQRIAREEGLSTLGMKDPGHVELPSGNDAGRTTRMASTVPTLEGPQGMDGRSPTAVRGEVPAAPPRVAQVAQVASVARVARVASPPRTAPSDPLPVSPAPSEPTPPTLTATHVATDAAPAPQRGSDRRVTSARDDAQPSSADVRIAGAPGRTPVAPVQGASGADAAARVEQVLEIRETMSTHQPQRVSVRMDGSGGPVERVQVELLDQVLRGQVDVDDPVLAARLRGDVAEVMRALEERGFEPQSIAVKLAQASAEAGRDGFSGAFRTDTAAQALRTILGSHAGTAGRDAQDRSGGEPRQGSPQQQESNQNSRRENRRESR